MENDAEPFSSTCAGRLECDRAGRSLAGLDGPASRGSRGLLVWSAGLDRARIQADQTRWLAMAIHAYERPSTCRTTVVGGGHRDVVVIVGWRGGRCPVAGRNDGRGATYSAQPSAALASDRHFPSRLDADPGRVTASQSAPSWRRLA